VNGHFPAQPFGFSPVLGLHGVKNRSWYSYHVAIFSLFSPKTGPNAAVNETSTDPSEMGQWQVGVCIVGARKAIQYYCVNVRYCY
jgi:hypothetical protein